MEIIQIISIISFSYLSSFASLMLLPLITDLTCMKMLAVAVNSFSRENFLRKRFIAPS